MATRSHKLRVVVPESHEIQVRLPSHFPTGVAELEVKAADKVESATSGANAANEFRRELVALQKRLPPAPVLPDAAFSRDQIYDE
jgi:hypothetical protein